MELRRDEGGGINGGRWGVREGGRRDCIGRGGFEGLAMEAAGGGMGGEGKGEGRTTLFRWRATEPPTHDVLGQGEGEGEGRTLPCPLGVLAFGFWPRPLWDRYRPVSPLIPSPPLLLPTPTAASPSPSSPTNPAPSLPVEEWREVRALGRGAQVGSSSNDTRALCGCGPWSTPPPPPAPVCLSKGQLPSSPLASPPSRPPVPPYPDGTREGSRGPAELGRGEEGRGWGLGSVLGTGEGTGAVGREAPALPTQPLTSPVTSPLPP